MWPGSRPLTIRRPSLTQLSTDGHFERSSFLRDAGIALPISMPFSFHCPLLTKVCLSYLHSTPHVLNAMAVHAPNFSWLSVDCEVGNPLDSVYRFKFLCTLKLRNCRRIDSQSIAQLPLLQTLSLRGEGMASGLLVGTCSFKANDLWKLRCAKLDIAKTTSTNCVSSQTTS